MPGPFPAIIVVEDAPDILIVLRRVLHDLQLEHDIITVDNGLSALAQASQHPCALLITDYMLSGINGLELAREFKARWRSAVIMITAYATPELREAARAAGVDRFLSKPFMVEALEEAVYSMLRTQPS
ncbi:MAG TPA: response regulator [Herpetosiphonaceae bacterium]